MVTVSGISINSENNPPSVRRGQLCLAQCFLHIIAQVLPKKKIANLKSLKSEDIHLLQKMYDEAMKITKGTRNLSVQLFFLTLKNFWSVITLCLSIC